MIYVTHDQVEAMTLAHRVAVMRNGKIQQIDTPQAVYARPANMFVAGFLGSPSMNFLEGELEVGPGGETTFIKGALSMSLQGYEFAARPVAGRRAILGIRPEHLAIDQDDLQGATAQVTLVEPMGSHLVVWLSFLEQQLSVTMPVGGEPVPGQRVALRFDATRASLFDPESQQRL